LGIRTCRKSVVCLRTDSNLCRTGCGSGSSYVIRAGALDVLVHALEHIGRQTEVIAIDRQ